MKRLLKERTVASCYFTALSLHLRILKAEGGGRDTRD